MTLSISASMPVPRASDPNQRALIQLVEHNTRDLSDVDPQRIITRARDAQDGASSPRTARGAKPEQALAIRLRLASAAAAEWIGEEPSYSRAGARLLAAAIDAELSEQGITSFSDSIRAAFDLGLINDRLREFVAEHSAALERAMDTRRNDRFEYFGLKTVYDRYLLRHPRSRAVLESPQHFFLRIACALATSLQTALELYELASTLQYLPSSPTLFNAGTRHEQLSSCFLLDSPGDHLANIYDRYKDVALLSKFSGGIGLAFHRVRSRGSLIESTNGHSNGIVPWLKTLDASVAAVNQGGKRKGACCVYLETWHADIEEFLELRDNTGDHARRTHHLNLANWVPDLFMRRVESDALWSLFDPKTVPQLSDLYGDAFDREYERCETAGLAVNQVPARELYGRMMRTLAETGNGWMTFKDKCNLACNQTAAPGAVVHLSNLCTEIVEVTSENETAVCNLGSLNLGQFVSGGTVDFARLRQAVKLAVRSLDRVIDLNYYPIASARASNVRWRPIGLGAMGLADVLFQLRLPFDSEPARELNRRIFEEIYHAALEASVELAQQHGPHPAFAQTRAARGQLQFDAWGVQHEEPRWQTLRQRIVQTGLRNSLLIAIAPTATIASIAGCYECVEPQVSNLFKRETLSGDFLQVNRYLVAELKQSGLWTAALRNEIKRANGSIQHLEQVPAHLRAIYRTAWELPMRSLIDMAADRGAYIDQSQSLNLFMENPNIGTLSSMYFYAWKRGLKTTYYLRSRPATRIAQTTVAQPESANRSQTEAIACSLENPETCEACQ